RRRKRRTICGLGLATHRGAFDDSGSTMNNNRPLRLLCARSHIATEEAAHHQRCRYELGKEAHKLLSSYRNQTKSIRAEWPCEFRSLASQVSSVESSASARDTYAASYAVSDVRSSHMRGIQSKCG